MPKSRKYEDRLPNGDAVIEFYSSLDVIEDYYKNKGYRKISRLHKILKEKFNWKMPYDTFRYHFNKEFKTVEKERKQDEEKSLEIKENMKKTAKTKPPIFVTVGGTDNDDFFTKNDIPEDRRL